MKDIEAIRRAVADYMYSEGCSCCQDQDAHDKHRAELAKLLRVPKRNGWHDFSKYRTKEKT